MRISLEEQRFKYMNLIAEEKYVEQIQSHEFEKNDFIEILRQLRKLNYMDYHNELIDQNQGLIAELIYEWEKNLEQEGPWFSEYFFESVDKKIKEFIASKPKTEKRKFFLKKKQKK